MATNNICNNNDENNNNCIKQDESLDNLFKLINNQNKRTHEEDNLEPIKRTKAATSNEEILLDKIKVQSYYINIKNKELELNKEIQLLKDKNLKDKEKIIEQLENRLIENSSTSNNNISNNINKLIVNYNSTFANQLYNKINNSFNFFKITSIHSGKFKGQEEFCKFIVLKIMDEDYEIDKPSKLIPSPFVQSYWEYMIMDTFNYQQFLKELQIDVHFCIHDKLDLRTPISNLKRQELRLKYERTIELYKFYFPQFNSDLNNFNIWPNDYLKTPHYQHCATEINHQQQQQQPQQYHSNNSNNSIQHQHNKNQQIPNTESQKHKVIDLVYL